MDSEQQYLPHSFLANTKWANEFKGLTQFLKRSKKPTSCICDDSDGGRKMRGVVSQRGWQFSGAEGIRGNCIFQDKHDMMETS